MTSFEDSESRGSRQPDDFRIDEEMREIQSQLESDAQHLLSLYPPNPSSRLKELVGQCLTSADTSSLNEASLNEAESSRHKQSLETTTVAVSKSTDHSSRSWFQALTGVSTVLLLVGSIAYLWNQPGMVAIEKPVVAHQSKPDFALIPAASVSTLPPQFLNASQPELEAIYDEMPVESMSIEF